MAEDKLTMFGKTYNTVGSADSNLILQTRGDLKIRWGNKFIDLIKNGKIAVDVEFLKKANSKDSINSDGIYLVKGEENDEIWISIGGEKYNLYGEISSDYVSFVKPQETTIEQKYQALQNIGLCYNTYQEALDSKIQQGIVYCEDSKKLYTIKDGLLTEYTIDITWPEQLVIGNITIDGKTSSICSKNELHIGVGTTKYISCTGENLEILKHLILNGVFESSDFSENSGFAIQEEEGSYTLVIDNLKLRGTLFQDNETKIQYLSLYDDYKEGKLIAGHYYIIYDFQNEWELTKEIITVPQKTVVTPAQYDPITGVTTEATYSGHDINVRPIRIKAISPTEFEKVCHFVDNPEWDLEYDINFRGTIVKEVDGETWLLPAKGRITKLTDEKGNTANFDFKHRTFKTQNDINNDNLEYDEEYRYMFNQNNPGYYRNSSVNYSMPFLSQYYHQYRDASQYDDQIYNNTVRIKEPEISQQTVQVTTYDNVNQQYETNDVIINDVITIYDEYVIFNNITYDNDVGFRGKYIINNEFSGNSFREMTDSQFGPNSCMRDCTFTGSILDKFTINGEATNCFFGYSYNVTIDNTIENCSFKAIMGPAEEQGGTFNIIGPLSNVVVQQAIQKVGSNIGTADGAESLTDPSVITEISEFIISSSVFPRLASNGTKTCNIVERVYNDRTYKVFAVSLSSEDNTPPGIIAMYSGLRTGIPSGWVICDGNNGTPDLRGRFIRMVDIGEQCGPQNNPDLVSRNIQQDGYDVQTRQMYLNKTVKYTHVYKTYSDQIAADYSGLNISYVANTVNGLTTSGSQYQQLVTDPNISGVPVSALPDIDVSGDIYVNITMTPAQDAEPDFPEYINVEPQAL